MENHEHRNAPNERPLLLPPHEDYLGQWLAILVEHYPGELTQLSTIAYRIGLSDLSPRELDIAFTAVIRNTRTNFRPTAGVIRGYLHDARLELHAAEVKALPEAKLTPEEASEILAEIKKRAAAFGPSDLDVARSAIKKAREELAAIPPVTNSCVIEFPDDETLQARKEQAKKAMRDWEAAHPNNSQSQAG